MFTATMPTQVERLARNYLRYVSTTEEILTWFTGSNAALHDQHHFTLFVFMRYLKEWTTSSENSGHKIYLGLIGVGWGGEIC